MEAVLTIQENTYWFTIESMLNIHRSTLHSEHSKVGVWDGCIE